MSINAPELIGTTTPVRPAELATYHRNPRRGDVKAIAASLRAHGQYKPICVNVGTYTGRANEVLAGNHTLRAFRDLAEADPDDPRWQTILAHWVDVDDDRAARIMVADNRLSELGGFDTAELLSLLNDIGTDLDVLGFTPADIEKLEGPDKGTGEKLELWGSTLGEPDVKVPRGSLWRMGHHILAVCSVHTDWALWAPLLADPMIFAPYPSLMLPYCDHAQSTPMLMVQPDQYIAGWIVTKWNRLHPDSKAVGM